MEFDTEQNEKLVPGLNSPNPSKESTIWDAAHTLSAKADDMNRNPLTACKEAINEITERTASIFMCFVQLHP